MSDNEKMEFLIRQNEELRNKVNTLDVTNNFLIDENRYLKDLTFKLVKKEGKENE